ncbi:MAG: HAMP domain-containing sensor histidine kinase [Bacteroidota bacterium]
MSHVKNGVICFLLLLSALAVYGKERQSTEDSIKSLLSKGRTYLYDNPTKSLQYCNEAYDLVLGLENDSLLAAVLNGLGAARWSKGNIGEALAVFQYSLNISKANDLVEMQMRNSANIGNVYSSAALFYDAINFFKEASRIQDSYSSTSFDKFAINSNLGRAYQQLDMFDSSMYYFEKARQHMDSSFVHLFSIYYYNQAEAFYRSGEIPTADSILRDALKSAKKYNSARAEIRINQLLAEIELIYDNEDIALAHAELAHSLAEESEKKELLLLTHGTLSSCYARLGDYKKAYIHDQLAEAFQETLQGRSATNELELLSFNKRQTQINALGQESQLAQEQSSQRQKAIYLLILGLVVCFFLIAIIIDRNRKINAQSGELSELNDFKNRLFAVITHDIKSPVQSMSMVVDLLSEKKLSDDELKFLLPDIRKKIGRLNQLLNSLFQWAQGKLSEKTLSKEKVCLKTLFSDLKEELYDRLKEKEIQLVLEVSDDFEMFADPGIIKIVFRNLLTNAIKFSWSKSVITVKSTDTSQDSIIEIIDQGIGISKHAMEGIFNMEISSKDGTQGEKGNGLGLVLSKDFIKGQGGEIEVQSELGVGTTFRVTLPKSIELSK